MSKILSTASGSESTLRVKQQCSTDTIKVLSLRCKEDPCESTFSLLGMAYFENGQYDLAADAYRKALLCSPAHIEWEGLLQQSKKFVIPDLPAKSLFGREQLLSAAVIKSRSGSGYLLLSLGRSFRAKIADFLHHLIGFGYAAHMQVPGKL